MALNLDQIREAVLRNTAECGTDWEAAAREINDLFMEQLEEAAKFASTIIESKERVIVLPPEEEP